MFISAGTNGRIDELDNLRTLLVAFRFALRSCVTCLGAGKARLQLGERRTFRLERRDESMSVKMPRGLSPVFPF